MIAVINPVAMLSFYKILFHQIIFEIKRLDVVDDDCLILELLKKGVKKSTIVRGTMSWLFSFSLPRKKDKKILTIILYKTRKKEDNMVLVAATTNDSSYPLPPQEL